jgi:hypothetical protein
VPLSVLSPRANAAERALQTSPEQRLADPAIPSEVERFVSENVETAEQLDALVLLCSNPERAWTADALSQALFSVPQSAARTLERLEERRFAAQDAAAPGSYRYAAAGEDARRIAEVAAAYRANRAAVIKLLFQRRVDPVRSLADAFRLRKD